jgi:hypothetical protein
MRLSHKFRNYKQLTKTKGKKQLGKGLFNLFTRKKIQKKSENPISVIDKETEIELQLEDIFVAFLLIIFLNQNDLQETKNDIMKELYETYYKTEESEEYIQSIQNSNSPTDDDIPRSNEYISDIRRIQKKKILNDDEIHQQIFNYMQSFLIEEIYDELTMDENFSNFINDNFKINTITRKLEFTETMERYILLHCDEIHKKNKMFCLFNKYELFDKFIENNEQNRASMLKILMIENLKKYSIDTDTDKLKKDTERIEFKPLKVRSYSSSRKTRKQQKGKSRKYRRSKH